MIEPTIIGLLATAFAFVGGLAFRSWLTLRDTPLLVIAGAGVLGALLVSFALL